LNQSKEKPIQEHAIISIETWQINLRRAVQPSRLLAKQMENKRNTIVLVQEPYTVGNRVCAKVPGCDLHVGNTKGARPRACIYTRDIDTWQLPQFSDNDMTTIQIKTGADHSPLIIASVYMAHDNSIPSAKLRALTEYCQHRKIPLLVGSDCNSHHTAWGSSNINERGQSLLEFIEEQELDWLNNGNEPTFDTRERKEVLDITLVNQWAQRLAGNWRVDPTPTGSDHRYIRFTISEGVAVIRKYRPIRGTDWKTFLSHIEENLQKTTTPDLTTPQGVEEEANLLETIMREGLERACPEKTVKSKTEITWWTAELEKKRKKKFHLLAKAQRTKAEKDWKIFREAQADLKKSMRKTSRDSFRKRMETVETAHELSRAVKFLQSDTSIQLSAVKDEHGELTESPKATLDTMLKHHVPETEGQPEDMTNLAPSDTQSESCANQIVTEELMDRAANRFDPYKSPGCDGIYPIMIQKALTTPIRERYCQLFRASLKMGHIPQSWRKAKGIFIPKPGKSTYTDTKSYRMITLTSFQLKWLERLVLWHLDKNPKVQARMHKRQFGFKAGVSTETALHHLVRRIEKAMENGEYAVGVFLDIQNAFPTVAITSITKALKELGIAGEIQSWINTMLRDRWITVSLKDTTVAKKVTRGCPQGGILSPFLWNIVMNDFLKKTDTMGVYAQAYADDIAGLLVGKDPPTLVSLANTFMKRATEWGRNNDLKFSQAKTEIVIFTKKKWNTARSFQIEGSKLTASKTAKYLGVTLDNQLSFKQHVETKIKTATQLLHRVGRLVGKTWGLTPHRARWVYTAMVRPLIAYGAICWAKATTTAKCENALRKLQRIALIQITAAYPFSPTAALEMLTGLRPLHLHLQEVAVMASVRLKREGHWQKQRTAFHKNGWQNTHSDFCNRIRERIPALHMPEDESGITWLENQNFSSRIEDRTVAAGRTYTDDEIICYTDGSKLAGGKTGAGVIIMRGSHETSLHEHLGLHTTVYQAEVRAIQMAAEQLTTEHISQREITFRVDNRAAIQSLCNSRTTKHSVRECSAALNELGRTNTVTLEWVPGHSGIPGNERADEQAKKGARENLCGPEPFTPVPATFVKEQVSNFFEEKHQQAWWSENRFRKTKETVGWAAKPLAQKLITLNRESIRHLVQLITGHGILEQHRFRSNQADDPICPKCGEEPDTSQHFFETCSKYQDLRERIFGTGHITLKEELHTRNIYRMAKFIRLSKRLNPQGES